MIQVARFVHVICLGSLKKINSIRYLRKDVYETSNLALKCKRLYRYLMDLVFFKALNKPFITKRAARIIFVGSEMGPKSVYTPSMHI